MVEKMLTTNTQDEFIKIIKKQHFLMKKSTIKIKTINLINSTLCAKNGKSTPLESKI